MQETKMPKKILIGTPMYNGDCKGHYVTGLLTTMNVLRSAGIEVHWCQIMNESLITRARNDIARIFLEGDFDHLMFIDADTVQCTINISSPINSASNSLCRRGINSLKSCVRETAINPTQSLPEACGQFQLLRSPVRLVRLRRLLEIDLRTTPPLFQIR